MDLLLEALSLALADVDTQLRSEHPDLFVRVDAILAQPGRQRSWKGFEEIGPTDVHRRRECLWCGETFFVYERKRKVKGATCTPACRVEYRAWLAKRRGS